MMKTERLLLPAICLISLLIDLFYLLRFDKPQLQLPSPPDEPTTTDCCNNGCTPCVFDVYREELQAHNEQVDMLRKEYTKICKNNDSIVDLESLRLPSRNSAADKVTSRKQYIGYKVLETSRINHDTILIVGKVPLSSSGEQRSLGIQDGEHVLVRLEFNAFGIDD